MFTNSQKTSYCFALLLAVSVSLFFGNQDLIAQTNGAEEAAPASKGTPPSEAKQKTKKSPKFKSGRSKKVKPPELTPETEVLPEAFGQDPAAAPPSTGEAVQPGEVSEETTDENTGLSMRATNTSNHILWASLGYIKLLGDAKKYAHSGLQYGVEWNLSLGPIGKGARQVVGLIYRRANLKGELDPVAGGTNSKVFHTRINYLATYGFHWGKAASLGWFTDAEVGLARRRFKIESGSNAVGDDYYSKTGMAYGLRGGLDGFIVNDLKWRASLGFLTGTQISSGRLKYNGENASINGMDMTLGLDLGWQF